MLKGVNALTDRVYDHCITNDLIAPGMKVIVGVSGGADSVCLLRMLNELKDPLDLTLVCVHIEHGIRGEESRSDRDFVRDLCGKLDIKLKVYEEDVPAVARENSMTLEEAGRYVRYEAFLKELAGESADVIAVAHHKGDQAETVLFNMIRGSGLRGMSGMAPVNGKIIRPLLILTRNEIEGYLKDIGQDYRIDSTNEDDSYTRNSIRNKIIPELIKISPCAIDHIISEADEAREADDYIRKQAWTVYDKAVYEGSPISVDINILSEEPTIIRRYVLRSLLTRLYTSHKDLEAEHVKSLLLLCDKQSGRYLNLPRGMAAKREGDKLLIGRVSELENPHEEINIPFNTEGETIVPGRGVFITSLEERADTADIPDSLYTKWFDYDKIVNRLFVRTRMSGDYLTIGPLENRKKLKNYLIDEKVPASLRNQILVLADGSHILWVVGMRISEHYKISSDTKRVIKVVYKEITDG